MEYLVEKFQRTPSLVGTSTLQHNGSQRPVYKSIRPATVLQRRPNQLKPQLKNRRLQKLPDNVELNLAPDGNALDVSINGTTLNVTKTSLNATIGIFSINVSYKEEVPPRPPTPLDDRRPLSQAKAVVINLELGKPLCVVMGEEDSPFVTANISLCKFITKTFSKQPFIVVSPLYS